MSDAAETDITGLTVQLLSAYLANNAVAPGDLAELIRSTRAALTESLAVKQDAQEEAYVSAVSVRKSLASSDHIISLIDGKPYQTLKRHLAAHGLTPDAYRERYKLSHDYPMVSRRFAERRREIAAQIGLGRKRAAKVASIAPAETTVKESAISVSPNTASKPTKRGGASAKSTLRTKVAKSDATVPTAALPELAPAKKARRMARASADPISPASIVAAAPVSPGAQKSQPKAKVKAARKPTLAGGTGTAAATKIVSPKNARPGKAVAPRKAKAPADKA